MEGLPLELIKPKSIIVVSAHWEEEHLTITGGENPHLLYDYYGFPKEAYEFKYPAKGNPSLEKELKELFEDNGIKTRINNDRGFDHGVFIPLKMMYPQADIPVTQISLIKGLDPKLHIKIGNVLKDMVQDNILLIGSGFSFHNMREFDWKGENRTDSKNDEFQNWLSNLLSGELSEREKENKLINWEEHTSARYCHPREEHLIPLHVCFGSSMGKGQTVFDDYILGKRALAIKW